MFPETIPNDRIRPLPLVVPPGKRNRKPRRWEPYFGVRRLFEGLNLPANMITDEIESYIAFPNNALYWEISKGWFGAREPRQYWGCTCVRVECSFDSCAIDDDLSRCFNNPLEMWQYLIGLVESQSGPVHAKYFAQTHLPHDMGYCQYCQKVTHNPYHKHWCSVACYNTQFGICKQCGVWNMSVLSNLTHGLLGRKEREALCDTCFNKKHGLGYMTLTFSSYH